MARLVALLGLVALVSLVALARAQSAQQDGLLAFGGPLQDSGYELVVDCSTKVTKEQWACLKGDLNVSQAIVRAWRSLGDFDPNAKETIESAHAAGIKSGKPTPRTRSYLSRRLSNAAQNCALDVSTGRYAVDAYMFPCIKCKSFEEQVSA